MNRPPASWSDRLFRRLLRLLPLEFRLDFSSDMEDVFREERADATRRGSRLALMGLWARTIAGLIATAPREHADILRQDIGYGWRALTRSAGVTAAAIGILAVALAATLSVFSLLNAVVLRRLPVVEPDRLVYLDRPSFSYPIFSELRARSRSLEGLFGWTGERFNARVNGDWQQTESLLVSGEFFRTLGIGAAIGRTIGPDDDRPGGGSSGPVCVISHAAWQRRFGSDPAVLGRTILVGQLPLTVVGVAPPGFFGVAVGIAPEVFVPVTLAPRLFQEAGMLQRPGQAWLHIMGRLRDGVSLEAADAELQTIWPQVLEATTGNDMPQDRRLRYLSRRTALQSGSTGFSRVRNQFVRPLRLLMGLVLLLLVVACATVGTLLLSRATPRQREVAVRIAMGAGYGRLVRQFLTEGLLLATAAGALGLLLARWTADALVGLLSTSREPISLALPIDAPSVVVAVLLVALATVFFSTAPMLRLLRGGPATGLRTRPLGRGRGGARTARTLVVAEVALSTLLIIGAALFARSLSRLVTLDPGFDRTGILLASLDLMAISPTGDVAGRYGELLDEIRSVPGVRSASLAWVPPLSDDLGSWTQSIEVDGRQTPEGEYTYFNAVSPGFFDTTRTRLVAGRDFGPGDDATAPRTVIVNEALAKAYFPDQSPLGHRVSVGRHEGRQDLTIVGIASDAKYQQLQESTRRIAYLPYLQTPEIVNGSNLVAQVRGEGPPEALIEPIRQRVRTLEPNLPVRFETMQNRLRESLVTERVLAGLSSVLGVLALILAGAGLYALVADYVAARTSEIGLRLALGAVPSDVFLQVLRETLRMALMGAAAGVAASLAMGRVLTSLLHGVRPTDPLAIAAAVTLLMALALVAGYLPARRAVKVDPIAALRVD
jgi:putative ABC transport system permease protein